MTTKREILWYGRGGQGAFSAAKLLGAAYASMGEGHHALAFPSFGPERRGAPVRAYTKLSEAPINDRSAVQVPDYIVCLDETLLSDLNGSQLREGGDLIAVTPHLAQLSREVLGREIVNTALLALLCTRLGTVDEAAVVRGIEETLAPRIRARNAELVHAVFDRADELLADAVRRPDVSAAATGLAALPSEFEYMDLSTAPSIGGGPQQPYRPGGKGA